MKMLFLTLFLVLGCAFALEELDPNGIYCLSYTWLGADYNNPANTNQDDDEEGTEEKVMKCSDYLTTGNNSNTPCVEPIIFSSDIISRPDPVELWNNNSAAVACRKSGIQSCARYRVSFNGMISYESYLCTRVRTSSEVIRSGCLTEKRNNLDVQVCVCESDKGVDFPCNAANAHLTSSLSVLFLFLWIVYVHL